MKYKLVIFDFDGTLADSFPWFLGIANSIADTYNFKRIEASEIEALRGYSARQMIQHLGVPLWKMPLIARHARSLTARDIEHITLFEGVDRLLRRLSQMGVTLAIVSSNSYDNVRRVLGPDNAALIAYYECGASLFGKRARFRKILKQSGVLPSEALCIGDEIRDIEAATKEHIPFGAVAWGFTRLEALKAYAPAQVFARVDEIAECIA
ncbi:MAG TPA: HAD hydrolase-like protein [Herpetosiphonaceae bacterium]